MPLHVNCLQPTESCGTAWPCPYGRHCWCSVIAVSQVLEAGGLASGLMEKGLQELLEDGSQESLAGRGTVQRA